MQKIWVRLAAAAAAVGLLGLLAACAGGGHAPAERAAVAGPAQTGEWRTAAEASAELASPAGQEVAAGFAAASQARQENAAGFAVALPARQENASVPAVTSPEGQGLAAPAGVPAPEATAAPRPRKLVVLDPGHQRHSNNAHEAVGPDTRETKPKVSSGTVGVRTKKPEYVLNLEVSLLIQAELVSRGLEVLMTRESHEVDISNKQRAELANEAGAALAVRIHADGDSSPKTSGFSVLYPDATQAAVKPIAAASREAAALIAERLKTSTGTPGRGLSARSDLSGFNWSKVPVVLVELGFMTNPEEDERMSEAEYQQKLAVGIADGIEQYLSRQQQ